MLETLEIGYSLDFEEFFGPARWSLPFILTEFKIHGIHAQCVDILPFIESQSQYLRALSLDSFTVYDDDLNRLLSSKLKEIVFIKIYFILTPLNLKSTTIEKFSCVHILSDHRHSFIAIIESCPMLTTLSIQNSNISKGMSRSIASNLKKLKHLNLSNVTFDLLLFRMD